MARNTTLTELLDMYRAESRMSLNPAHNRQARDQQIAHIQRTQRWLWEDFDWPMLRVERTLSLQAGQRFYSAPDDMATERIQKVEVFYAKAYMPLANGIDAMHYTAYNPDLDERTWPPCRWRMAEDNLTATGQVEIWPLPSEDADPATLEGTVKLTGIRNLRPLVADTDRADLDDRLITLLCASENLEDAGSKGAGSKRSAANALYLKLRGQQSLRKKFTLFGVGQEERRIERVPIAIFHNPG